MTRATRHSVIVVFCVAMAVFSWLGHAAWWEAVALWLAAPALLYRAWSAEAELARSKPSRLPAARENARSLK